MLGGRLSVLKHPVVQAGLSATELVAAQLSKEETGEGERERGRAPAVVLCGATDTLKGGGWGIPLSWRSGPPPVPD